VLAGPAEALRSDEALRLVWCCHPERSEGSRPPSGQSRGRAAVSAPIAAVVPCGSDSPAVLGLRSRRITRYVRFAHCTQTDAASQMWERALRARRPQPCAPRRRKVAAPATRQRLCRTVAGCIEFAGQLSAARKGPRKVRRPSPLFTATADQDRCPISPVVHQHDFLFAGVCRPSAQQLRRCRRPLV